MASGRSPGLIFGTDAVAVGNGSNADDLLCRDFRAHANMASRRGRTTRCRSSPWRAGIVEKAGLDPMRVIVSATSANAAALGLGQDIGAVAPGYAADLLVVADNPLEAIAALRKVVMVMREGSVAWYDPVELGDRRKR